MSFDILLIDLFSYIHSNPLQIKYKFSVSLSTESELNDCLFALFGKDQDSPNKVSVGDIFGMAIFLDYAYYHDNDYPIINLLSPVIDLDNLTVEVDSEGINIMNILLNPQKIEIAEVDMQLTNKGGWTITSGEKIDFLLNSLQFKSSENPSAESLPIIGNIGSIRSQLKKILVDKWSAVSYTCNLPVMWLSQPLGYCLKRKISDKRVYVYIYLTLTTNVNQRRIVSTNEKLSWKKPGIVASMTNDEMESNTKTVDGSPIVIHPFFVLTNGSLSAINKSLDLRSPLANSIPSTIPNRKGLKTEHFSSAAYHAGVISVSKMKKCMKLFLNENELSTVFEDVPKKNNLEIYDFLGGVVLFINFYQMLNKKFNNFQSRDDFIKLYFHMVPQVDAEVESAAFGFKFPSNYQIRYGNVVFIARLMFRILIKDIAIMILEGNGRNYSACLAYTQCRDMNMFLNKPISKDLALNDPNYEFIARPIQCDYILHPRSLTMKKCPTYEYADVKEIYTKISAISFTNSQSSKNLSCFEFADTYFLSHVKVSLEEEKEMYFPLETMEKWPLEFKSKNRNFQLDAREKERVKAEAKLAASGKKRKRVLIETEDENESDWVMFITTYWMKEKKKLFFEKLLEKEFIIKQIKGDYNDYNSKRSTEKFSDEDFVEHLYKSDRHNPRSDLFEKANIVRCMSTLLSGIICFSKDNGEEGQGNQQDSIDTIGTLVKTNGIITTEFDHRLFSTSMTCSWLKKDDIERFHGGEIDRYAVSVFFANEYIVSTYYFFLQR